MSPATRTRSAALAVIAIALLLATAPGALAKAFGGLVPDIPTGGHVKPTLRAQAANLPYGGGPVMHTNRTHVIFWQPAGSGLAYDDGYETQVETFLRRVAHDSHKTTNVYSVSGQYHDQSGVAAYDSTFAGGILDTQPLPPPPYCTEPAAPPLGTGPGWSVCLSDSELVAELRHVTHADHLPVTSHDLYFLVLPNRFGVCESTGAPGCALGGGDDSGSFCGYHSSDSEGVLLYAVIPYNAVSGHCQSGSPRPNGSTADPALSTISHEHNEAVTDPTGTGWIDSNFNEDGDLCIDMTEHPPPTVGGSGDSRFSQVIGGGHYWLQKEWSNADGGCVPWARPETASFSVPKRIRPRQPIRFTASAHTGHARAKVYSWRFGRRGQGRGRVVTHSFSQSGSYQLVLRVTDTWGNWAYAMHTVTVTGSKKSKRKSAGSPRAGL